MHNFLENPVYWHNKSQQDTACTTPSFWSTQTTQVNIGWEFCSYWDMKIHEGIHCTVLHLLGSIPLVHTQPLRNLALNSNIQHDMKYILYHRRWGFLHFDNFLAALLTRDIFSPLYGLDILCNQALQHKMQNICNHL